jgi:hypothetical protein
MGTVGLIGRLALPVCALLLYGSAGANAEVVDVRQACTPDAMRLCSDFIPDVPKITACMHAKHAQLSVECRTAMAGGGHPEGRHHRGRVRRVHYTHHHS